MGAGLLGAGDDIVLKNGGDRSTWALVLEAVDLLFGNCAPAELG
jgi:hypothetical protein